MKENFVPYVEARLHLFVSEMNRLSYGRVYRPGVLYTADDTEQRLGVIRILEHHLAREQVYDVSRLRHHGYSWTRIGDVLNVSRQAALKRFSPLCDGMHWRATKEREEWLEYLVEETFVPDEGAEVDPFRTPPSPEWFNEIPRGL